MPAVAKAVAGEVGVAGFEPATPCSQSRCASRAALYPEDGCECVFGCDGCVCGVGTNVGVTSRQSWRWV